MKLKEGVQLKNGRVLFALILFSCCVRCLSWHYSNVDHDEGTYLTMANEMNHGELLYKDVIDIKPVGIYLIYAGIVKLGHSIAFLRFFTSVLIGCSAFLIFRIKMHFVSSTWLSVFSSLAYVVLISQDPLFKSGPAGLACNTEIFFCFFSLWSFWLVLDNVNRSFVKIALAGLLGGLGFIIKYVTLIECASFFIVVLVLSSFNNGWNITFFKKWLLSGIVYLLVFVIPFLAVHFYYYGIGEYMILHDVTYEMPKRYSQSFDFSKLFSFVASIHHSPVPVLMIYFWLILGKKNKEFKAEALAVGIWFVFVVLAIGVTGRQWDHNRVQFYGPMALLIPNLWFGLHWIAKRINFDRKVKLAFVYVTLAVCHAMYWQYELYLSHEDRNYKIADYIKDNSQSGDGLYCSQERMQILNFMCDLPTPARMVHTTNLHSERNQFIFKIDLKSEMEFVYHQAPKFVIGEDHVAASLVPELWDQYTIMDVIEGIPIYVRK